MMMGRPMIVYLSTCSNLIKLYPLIKLTQTWRNLIKTCAGSLLTAGYFNNVDYIWVNPVLFCLTPLYVSIRNGIYDKGGCTN